MTVDDLCAYYKVLIQNKAPDTTLRPTFLVVLAKTSAFLTHVQWGISIQRPGIVASNYYKHVKKYTVTKIHQILKRIMLMTMVMISRMTMLLLLLLLLLMMMMMMMMMMMIMMTMTF